MTLSSPPEPTGMALALGIERTAWSPGHACLEVTVTADHLNKGGAAHGGLMTVLLDAALGGALVSTLPTSSWCATTQLTTSFLDAARLGERLVATGRVVRRGRHVAHLSGEVCVGERVVASAVGTWAIWDKRPPSMPLRKADDVLRWLAGAAGADLAGTGAWHHTGQTGMTGTMHVEVVRGDDSATVLFDELHCTFDGALLMGARGEPEVCGIDVLPIGGHIDLRARGGHPLHTAENLHECSGSALQTGVFGIEGRATAHNSAGVELVHVHRLQLGAGHGQRVG